MSGIDKFLEDEFGDDTPKIKPGGLSAAEISPVEPVPGDLRKARAIFRGCGRHCMENFKNSHGVAMRKQLLLGEKLLDRMIRELETGRVLPGPLPRRNPA